MHEVLEEGRSHFTEKPLVEVETMLRDLEERAHRLGQGSGMGSGFSELGSDITSVRNRPVRPSSGVDGTDYGS